MILRALTLCVILFPAYALADLPLTDTFTEASDTELENHTPEAGAWDNLDRAMRVFATGDYVAQEAAGQNAHGANVSPSTADYYAEIVAQTNGTASSDRVEVMLRYDGGVSGAQTGYGARLQGDTGAISLYEWSAGSSTLLGSAYTIPSFSATTDYTIRLTANGPTISVDVGGVEQISETDSTHTTAGNPGIYIRGNGRITSMSAVALGGGGSAVPIIMQHQ